MTEVAIANGAKTLISFTLKQTDDGDDAVPYSTTP